MAARLAQLIFDKSKPGFYDDPTFIAAEKDDPALLDAYAAHVDDLSFGATYHAHARDRVTRSVSFLHERLRADGRKGACIDMSLMLMRFLERQGIWNYIVKGATAVYPAVGTGIEPAFHWLYDSQADVKSVAPHAWVCAPPYKVIDLTLGQQVSTGAEGQLLQRPILAEDARASAARIEEVFDPPIREAYRRQLGRPIRMEDLRKIDKELLKRLQRRATWEIELPNVQVRYIGVAVTAPKEPFEESTGWLMAGKSGLEHWLEFERVLRAG